MLLILSIPALKSLLVPGLYTSHDGETHAARIAQYYQALIDGQLPPRLAGSFYSGLGSPIFVYIYPVPYLITNLWHFLGASFVDSFKITMAISFIFSAYFTYLWLKEFFQSQKAAFVGAIYYVFVPYRFLLIYVRASLSEIIAYALLPLTLYLSTKLIKSKKLIYIPLIAISLGALLLSQNLVALFSLPVLALYSIILILSHRSVKTFIYLSLSVAWAALISSITYLPTFLERNYVRFDETISQTYMSHFVSLKQLFYSPWGYGFDLPGTVNDQMSFQIGLAQILVVALLLVLITLNLFKFRAISKYIDRFKKQELIALTVFLILTLISIILMLDESFNYEIWSKVKLLSSFIDIPWRLLGIVSLSCAFFAAAVSKSLKPGLITIALIAVVILANRNHVRINMPSPFDDNFFLNYTGSSTQYNEFTPIWRQSTRVPEYFDPKKKTEVYSGQAEVFTLKDTSDKLKFEVLVTSPTAEIIVHKFYFPGLQINLNGKELTLDKDYQITNAQTLYVDKGEDKSGLIKITLPSGSHNLELVYRETKIRIISDLITLTALTAAISLSLLFYVKKL